MFVSVKFGESVITAYYDQKFVHEAVFSLFVVSFFWYRFRLCVSAVFCGRAGDDTDKHNDACVSVVE